MTFTLTFAALVIVAGATPQESSGSAETFVPSETPMLRGLTAEAGVNTSTSEGIPIFAGQAAIAAASSGACSASDEAAMQRLAAFPEVVADCGRGAYSWFRWHKDQMRNCVQAKVGLSIGCTSCFVEAGQYGYDHCKLPCLLKWCSQSCLSCTGKRDADTQACIGSTVSVPKPQGC